MYKPLTVLGFGLAIMVAVGCGSDAERPTLAPQSTPTTPTDFVQYVDNVNSFSVSYPRDWETSPTQTEVLEDVAKDTLVQAELATDAQLAKAVILFSAGVFDEPFFPKLIVIVENLPFAMSAEEFFEDTMGFVATSFSSYRQFSVTKATLGGRETIVVDSEIGAAEMHPGEVGADRSIKLITVDGGIGWLVSCTVALGSAATTQHLDECNSAVRTFRLLP